MKSIEELAKGIGFSQRRLRDQLSRINARRKALQWSRQGWTLDKGRTALLEGEIPKWLWLHPEFKDTYFANDQDQEQRKKSMNEFLKKYPQFRLNR